MQPDWLIIGGGIHGVHLAARLLGEAGVSPDRLRIVDPGDRLLARWHTCTAITGMRHLRSPSVHHLDLDPWSLQRFAGKRKSREVGLFAPPYERPALSLFNAHGDRVIEAFGLSDLHIKDRVSACSIERSGVGVQLANGREIVARNVVLAIGASEQPAWPRWAPRGDPRVHHVFEPGFEGWPSTRETVAVVGGGISAGQVALRLLKEGHRVRIVARHGLRQHQFDSNPGWLGPKLMPRFSYDRDYVRRRTLIAEARHTGSVPPDVRSALRRAISGDRLRWHEGEVESLRQRSWGHRRGGLELRLTAGVALDSERVLLATGFASRRPGGAMVDEMIASASLPCAPCGYPIVDSTLCWHRRVYVTGPLAELELGPASRNIAGARRAGNRLVDAARAA
ncbi:MAG: FAD/NAD(P)-binding protein [Acidobacteriota bacterium]